MSSESAEADRSVFRTVGIISRRVVGVALLFVLLAFARWGAFAALGAAAGGGLASTEWIFSAQIGRRISSTTGGARVLWTLLFAVKSMVTFGCAGLALLYLDPRGLALGFGALFAGVIIGAFEAQIRASRAER